MILCLSENDSVFVEKHSHPTQYRLTENTDLHKLDSLTSQHHDDCLIETQDPSRNTSSSAALQEAGVSQGKGYVQNRLSNMRLLILLIHVSYNLPK